MSGFYTKLLFYLVYIRNISPPRTYGRLHNKDRKRLCFYYQVQ